MKRRKIEEYPPMVVGVILGLAFLIAGCITVYNASALERVEEYEPPIEEAVRIEAKAEPLTAFYAGEAEAIQEMRLIERAPLASAEATETTPEETAEPERRTLIASRDWDAEDSEILLRIAMAEAEGESTEGKALVMLVVLNRVWSEGFPNSIEGVVMQSRNGRYQFSPVAPGGRYWTVTPNEDCYRALEMVMYEGWDESDGALYFENCNGESWQAKNCEYLFTVGNHLFYR